MEDLQNLPVGGESLGSPGRDGVRLAAFRAPDPDLPELLQAPHTHRVRAG